MPTTFGNPPSLAAALIGDLRAGSRVIGIDGAPCAGKSTLANALAGRLQVSAVHLDDFLHREQGRFVGHLRYPELERRLATIDGAFLIEGVCLLDVAARIGLEINVLVYVKRIGHLHRQWQDDDELGAPEIGAIEWAAERADECHSELWREVILYHRRYLPHLRANYEFHRIESPQSDP